VAYILIARQRLGKHIPAEAYVRNNRMSITRQRISKEVFSTAGRMFSVWSVPSCYIGKMKSFVSVVRHVLRRGSLVEVCVLCCLPATVREYCKQYRI
jgi:hypothetical protein